jgi:hypothetical protein
MATMPDYQATLASKSTASAHSVALEIRNRDAAIGRAENAYAHSVQQSRMMSAVCFLVAAALAVGTVGAAATPMICMLAIAVLSSLTSKPIAGHQFRLEIQRTARAQGHSENDARSIAASMTAAWQAKRGANEDAEEDLETDRAAID